MNIFKFLYILRKKIYFQLIIYYLLSKNCVIIFYELPEFDYKLIQNIPPT